MATKNDCLICDYTQFPLIFFSMGFLNNLDLMKASMPPELTIPPTRLPAVVREAHDRQQENRREVEGST